MMEYERNPYDEIVCLRAELAALRADAEIGQRWNRDSSLETWFPYTAEELVRLRAERDALRAEVELWKERAYAMLAELVRMIGPEKVRRLIDAHEEIDRQS